MMGRYSFLAVFDKEPAVIATAIRAVLFVLVLFGLAVDEKQLAAIALALELVLVLFVRSKSTSTADPTLAVGTPVNSGAAVVASVMPPPEPSVEVPPAVIR